jgi:DNA-binding transcriptional ArsR family regulator
VEAFDVLGDPVRRRILELLAGGERAAGHVVDVVGREFGITQPAVSQHLRVLRESGFAGVRADGSRRLYSVNAAALDPAEEWIAGVRGMWEQRLDALGTELARGARQRRAPVAGPATDEPGRSRRKP